jgi:hypothetical protein
LAIDLRECGTGKIRIDGSYAHHAVVRSGVEHFVGAAIPRCRYENDPIVDEILEESILRRAVSWAPQAHRNHLGALLFDSPQDGAENRRRRRAATGVPEHSPDHQTDAPVRYHASNSLSVAAYGSNRTRNVST